MALRLTISTLMLAMFFIIAFSIAAACNWLQYYPVWSAIGLAGVAGFLLGKPLAAFMLRDAEKGGPFRRR